jgi:anthranilate synthase component 2
LKHGKTSLIQHDGRGAFRDQPNPFRATRYHSLIVEDAELPDSLEVSARSEDDRYIMGMRHRTLAIESVQFHPESVYTQDGLRIFQNFISTHVTRPREGG